MSSPQEWSPSEQTSSGLQNSLGLGGWKGPSFAVDLQISGGPGDTPSGPLQLSRALSRRLSATRPLGCMVGWFRGSLFWTTSQAARGPARGAGPGSRTRREGAGVGEAAGWDLSLAPLGAGPTANSAPTIGPSFAGIVERGGKLGLAEGRLHVRSPRRKFLESSCSTQEVRLQMSFLRVRPEIQACLGLLPLGPFQSRLG